jgi:hypothetical protein
MDNSGMSAADIALLNDRHDDWGGNSFMWIFALLILAGGGFGGLGWSNNGFANAIGYENLATSAEVQRGFDNQNSMANQREILAAVNAGTAQAVAATNQTFHDTVQYVGDKYNELDRDIFAVNSLVQQSIANQNECCCGTKLLITETAANQRYESAMQNNAVLQAIHEEGAATRAMMQQDKIEALQNRVNQLELQQATANVVRYPNGWTYNAGTNPFCNGGCCNGYNNI